MSTNGATRILLIRLSAIGDVVYALHGVAALRQARPDAFLGFLVEDKAASLLEGHPDIDRLHVYRRKSWQHSLFRAPGTVAAEASGFLAELRGSRYDVSVDLQGNLKGGVMSVLAGAPRRIGLAAGFGIEANHLFSTEQVGLPEGPVHRVDRVLRLLGPLGVDGPGGTNRIRFEPDRRRPGDEFLKERGLTDGGYAVLHPGTSAFGLHKRWPPEQYGEFADALRTEAGLPSVVTYGPGEFDLAATAAAASNGAAVVGPETPGLTALAWLIGRSGLFVAGDTGALHLAAYLGVPTVGLFGPKDPRIYGPRGPRTAVVFMGHDCSPCPKRSCPDPVCMKSITPGHVLNAARELLSQPVTAGPEKGD